MYCIVQYSNGFVEILPSKRVKKRKGYAVAKNCEVEILYENEIESFCTLILDKLSQNITNAETNAAVDKQDYIKIIVTDDQIVNPKFDLLSPISERDHHLPITPDVSCRSGHTNDEVISNWDSSGADDNLTGPEVTQNNNNRDTIQKALNVLTEHQPEPNVSSRGGHTNDEVISNWDYSGVDDNLTGPEVTQNNYNLDTEIQEVLNVPTEHQPEPNVSSRGGHINDKVISNWDSSGADDNLTGPEVTQNNNNRDTIQKALNVLTEHQPEPNVSSRGGHINDKVISNWDSSGADDNLTGPEVIQNNNNLDTIQKALNVLTEHQPEPNVSSRGGHINDEVISNWDFSGVDDNLSGPEVTQNNYNLDMEIQEALNVLNEHQPEPRKQRRNKAPQKKHCCFFCQKHLFKIYRHYTEVHKIENEVKEILNLPKKSAHRRSLLDKLRKRGDHLFNTKIKNENQNDIVCKETIQPTKVIRQKNVPCPNCLGYYSKFSIRHHIEKCMPVKEKKNKRNNIQAQCRQFENNLHPKAARVLRENIFPVLNDDDVTNAIRHDDLVITYANYLCRKYTAEHHNQQIRSNMRVIGRLILAMREMNPQINNLTDAFDPSNVDLIIEGIEKVAGLDEISNLYKSPATAMLLTTELKKICKLMEMEFVKKQDNIGRKKMEDLYLLFNLEFQVTVNKKGLETQKINYRRKKFNLPKTEQIAKFRIYLESKIIHYTKRLSQNYSFEDWAHLTEYSLVHLAIFNRKRPGETQRLLIDDYKNYEVIDNEDLSKDVDNLSREQIKKWARIRFTGKLGKNTALLIHRELGFKAIDLILKYRNKAGVSPLNRFVFGEPSQFNIQSTFQACNLIRKFSLESGIENPELLRTRLLRQHLATETARSHVESRLEGRVSDFMSHKRHIHEDYYVLTQKTDDITKVSTLLEEFSSVNDVVKKSKINSNENLVKMPKSLSVQITPIPITSKSVSSSKVEARPNFSSEEYSSEEEAISPAKFKYVMGKKQKRHPWSSTEKEKAREYFYDNIYNDMAVTKQKANSFLLSNQELYKKRTPHLIIQWVKCERKKVLASESGLKGQRLRWCTPEKEVLRTSSERHSQNGTIPSIAECELILEENKDILMNRTPQAVKAYLYSNIKKQNVCSQSF